MLDYCEINNKMQFFHAFGPQQQTERVGDGEKCGKNIV